MPSIASIPSTSSIQAASAAREMDATRRSVGSLDSGSKADLKSTFQDFAAGTFYKEMMKSLHKMHRKPAYLHGGQTEDIFQGQLNQQLAEDLAHEHGGQFADSLYQAFLQTGRV